MKIVQGVYIPKLNIFLVLGCYIPLLHKLEKLYHGELNIHCNHVTTAWQKNLKITPE